MFGPAGRRVLAVTGCVVLTTLGLADPAPAQSTPNGLPLPPGDVISGPVFRRNGSSVPAITTGADANLYLNLAPPTEAFTPSAPALAVRTTAPTQYVRAYTTGVTSPVGGFVAGSDTVRGLNAAQIRDVLALPFLPDALTIVQIPAGTCMIVGPAAPILGNFAANPPGIPTPGPWGHGGPMQESLIGLSANPGCAAPQFVPAAAFINPQPIGASALSYRLRAGSGNSLAVAGALDIATPPALFTDMDGIYNSLDLLNIGSPAPLQSALVQLDGEVHADTPTVEIEAARAFLGALHSQMRHGRDRVASDAPLQQWISGFGGGGGIAGSGDRHGVSYTMGGLAAGIEHRFNPDFRLGVAVGYVGSGYGINGLSGSGNLNTLSTALYASVTPGDWYVDAALGYGYGFGTLGRSIVFPGVARVATSSPSASELLSSAETGYRIPLAEHTALTPFASLQAIAVLQNGLSETGAGAVDLHVQRQTTWSARGILGAELSHGLPVGLPMPLLLTLRAGWAHEFANPSRGVTAGFAGLPGATFSVHGVPVPRDAAVAGIGASLAVQPSIEILLRYDGALASGASTQAGSAALRFTF
jgi:outer membrane autotransporter protein